jgi:hypothetical protein
MYTDTLVPTRSLSEYSSTSRVQTEQNRHIMFYAKGHRAYLPEQELLLPPSLREWLPENHLVYFVSDVVDQLDLSAIHAVYEKEKRGQPPYDPRLMTKLLVYGYCGIARLSDWWIGSGGSYEMWDVRYRDGRRATPNARISAMSGVQSLADQKADRSWITAYPEVA